MKEGASWTWSALRPNPVCGFRCLRRRVRAPPAAAGVPAAACPHTKLLQALFWFCSTGSFMNLTTSIAVYASICKELGLPLRWGALLSAALRLGWVQLGWASLGHRPR